MYLTIKTMNKLYYFKVAFITISISVFAGSLTYGLFDVDFSNSKAIIKLLERSFATGIIDGLIIGLINIFFKIIPLKKKKD